MQVRSGEIIYYRVFDIGNDVDLSYATEILGSDTSPAPFKLRKPNRALIISESPVVVSLGAWEQEFLEKSYVIIAEAKIWSYGAISVTFRIQIDNLISFEDYKTLSRHIEGSEELHELALEKTKGLCNRLEKVVPNAKVWEHYEDYIIHNILEFKDKRQVTELIKKDALYSLILTEKEGDISDQLKSNIRNYMFQYSADDLVVVDWNSAFIYDYDDHKDIADVIEFALVQILELQYYDNQIDYHLNTLYKSLVHEKPSIFNNKYASLSRESALIYIDYMEVLERIENSLKVIGDFYYANIFRATSDKLRFRDLRGSVNNKLENLAEVSRLFQGEVNEKRGQFLEIVIIVLIAVEVIPLLWSVFNKIPWGKILNT